MFNYNLSRQPRATNFWSTILPHQKWKVSMNLCKNNWTASASQLVLVGRKKFELLLWVGLFCPQTVMDSENMHTSEVIMATDLRERHALLQKLWSCKQPSAFGYVSISGRRTKIKVHFSELSRPKPGSTRKPSTFTFRGNKTLKLICTKICALRLGAEVVIEHHYWRLKAIVYSFNSPVRTFTLDY